MRVERRGFGGEGDHVALEVRGEHCEQQLLYHDDELPVEGCWTPEVRRYEV